MKNRLIDIFPFLKNHFKFLLILISIALSASSCYLVKDITKSDQSICPVHNKQMHRELFWIHYGLILGCDHSLLHQNAKGNYFPNSSDAKVFGGCVVGKEKWVKKWVCSECSVEDDKWQKRIKDICTELGIEEHVLCNTSFNFGVASLQKNKLIESAFGFTFCYTAYPNFHLNDKAHYWLTIVFLRLGDFSMAKFHFISSVQICLKNPSTGINISDSLFEPLITLESETEFNNILKRGGFKESSEIFELNNFNADLRTLIKSLLNAQIPVNEYILNKYRQLNGKYVNSPEKVNSILTYDNSVEKTVENIRKKIEPNEFNKKQNH